jgi:hypothetical protein
VFYGLKSPEEFDRLITALREVKDLYDGRCFVDDMLVTVMRNMSFTRDVRFVRAMRNNACEEGDLSWSWRLHTLVWAAKSALQLPGDFVECGVFRGFMSSVVAEVLEFEKLEKTFYLYDTFGGLAETYSAEYERQMTEAEYRAAAKNGYSFEAVSERFAKYPNVKVVRGVVPEVLHEEAPDEIAYLHIDLNAVEAEIGALEVLFERVTPSGLIVFDDYGHLIRRPLHDAENAWMAERGYVILELPTGQGLVVKR